MQKSVADAYGDLNMRALVKGDVIQLERKGYWIVDQAADPSAPEKVQIMGMHWGRGDAVPPHASSAFTCCRLPPSFCPGTATRFMLQFQ